MGYVVKGQWEYAVVILNPVIDNAFQPLGASEVEIQVASPSGRPDSWFLVVHDRRQRAGMGMTGLGINGASGKAE